MITAQPLTNDAFAPFGQLLQGSGAPTERRGFAALIENLRPDAMPNMTYMKLLPERTPIRVEALERHCFSNQTFIPLNGTRHLVAVCPSTPDGAPVISALQIFIAGGSQAVNYNKGVWHAPRMALSAPGEFVMFRFDNGGTRDTDLIQLDEAVEVDLSNI